jgi:hypothetical protein
LREALGQAAAAAEEKQAHTQQHHQHQQVETLSPTAAGPGAAAAAAAAKGDCVEVGGEQRNTFMTQQANGVASCNGCHHLQQTPGHAGPLDETQQQQRQQQEQQPIPSQQPRECLLQLLSCLAASQQPLPPLDYPHLLQQQLHLPWPQIRSPVVKRTSLSRPPGVLLLQLQRAVYTGFGGAGGGAKVQGHVQFPLRLSWAECQAAREGPQEWRPNVQQQQQQDALVHFGEEEATQQQQQQQGGAASACGAALLYDLMAVVQHLGSGDSCGHYIMYRRVQQQQQQQPGGGASPSSSSSVSWLRVSDRFVVSVSEADVLQCHATLLVYERSE